MDAIYLTRPITNPRNGKYLYVLSHFFLCAEGNTRGDNLIITRVFPLVDLSVAKYYYNFHFQVVKENNRAI